MYGIATRVRHDAETEVTTLSRKIYFLVLLSCMALPTLCFATPLLTTPSFENVGPGQVTLVLQSSGSGTGYFTLLAGNNATCGTGAQVAAGLDSSGTGAPYHGSLPLAATTTGRYTVRNLTQGTPYTACFAADSPSGSNLSPIPVSANLTTGTPATLLTPFWGAVGNAGFSADVASFISLAFAPDGTPYVAYSDYGNSGKATMMTFDGMGWGIVGNAGFSAGRAINISLAFAPDGTPYVAYCDLGNSNKATVMKYNNGVWSALGIAGFSPGAANFTSLAFAPDGAPCVAFKDGANSNKATVMKFDGTNWNIVGNAGFSAGQADYTSLAFAPDGAPCVAYKDAASSSKATMMKFDGTNWVTVGTAGFSAGQADYTSLDFAPDGTTYVVYEDSYNNSMATAMKFDGSNWVTVGSAGFSAGQAYFTSLAIAPDNTPYVVYEDKTNNTMATVMRFDGSNWVTVGSAGFSAGQALYTSIAFAPDGTPYVAYMDYGNGQKATVMNLAAVKATPVTTVISSANPSTFGQAITLTATLSPENASGTVTFLDGANSLGTSTLAGGIATYNTSALGAGNHSITAFYRGDSNYHASTSSSLAQTVNKGNSATTVNQDLNASIPGQSVTFTANVTSGATGVVTFTEGGTTLCPEVALNIGMASCSTSFLSVGSHTITAAYSGDVNHANSGGSVDHSVKSAATITLDAATLNTSYDGTAKTVTATTNPGGLGYLLTYNGNTTPPSAIGSYTVSALITDNNYLGNTTGILVIRDPAIPVIQTFTALPRANYLIADTTIVATDDVGVTGYCVTESTNSTDCTWSPSPTGSYTFATAGLKTLYAFARDAAGNVSPYFVTTLIVNSPILTVAVGGTGTGTVTTSPAGISCTNGVCTSTFTGKVNLYATPSVLSNFVGWGEACNGLVDACSVTMNGPKTVTATFNAATLLHIGGTTYPTLQAAYEAATRGAVIQMLDNTITGTLTAGKSITVTLKGGYDPSYTSITGTTALTGPIKIQQGKIEADKIVIR